MSVAVGIVHVATAEVKGVLMEMLDGQLLKEGGIMSFKQKLGGGVHVTDCGFDKLKPKPPRCPLPNENWPLAPKMPPF